MEPGGLAVVAAALVVQASPTKSTCATHTVFSNLPCLTHTRFATSHRSVRAALCDPAASAPSPVRAPVPKQKCWLGAVVPKYEAEAQGRVKSLFDVG